jgi:hypothetical protein
MLHGYQRGTVVGNQQQLEGIEGTGEVKMIQVLYIYMWGGLLYH